MITDQQLEHMLIDGWTPELVRAAVTELIERRTDAKRQEWRLYVIEQSKAEAPETQHLCLDRYDKYLDAKIHPQQAAFSALADAGI
jgi:hypothetical protein